MYETDKRAKLIKSIFSRKEYYDGILLKDLYILIKEHPNFEYAYGKSIKNNQEQYKGSTRALLQYRSENMNKFKGKDKDFYYLGFSKYASYDSDIAKEKRDEQSKIISSIKEVENMKGISQEDKMALVKTRLNQSKFRKNLINELWNGSPIKKVKEKRFLIASHILDYSKCKNENDRANHENGLLLAPDMDKLFDIKEITFDSNTGRIIFIGNRMSDYEKMGIHKGVKLDKEFMTDDRKAFFKMRNDLLGM